METGRLFPGEGEYIVGLKCGWNEMILIKLRYSNLQE